MLVVAGTSMAREITPLRGNLDFPEVTRDAGDCVVGNDNTGSVLGYYDAWFWGSESYAVPFNATEESCVCGVGVAIKSIHMLIALDELANLDVAVAILDAEASEAGCLVPGAELVVSPAYTITGIPALNYYDLEFPIEGPCATSGDALFLAVYFLNDNDGQFFGLPISDPPSICYSYNDWGSGWVDLVVAGEFAGNILIWADVDCCAEPVDNEQTTLDSIKSLYR